MADYWEMQELTLLFGSGADHSRAQIEFQSWKRGPALCTLWPNDVHVWRIRLDTPCSNYFDEALSHEDRIHGKKFRFGIDRSRFVAARASLRLILNRYLRIPAAVLRFAQNSYGKPYLDNSQNPQGLRFNLSHSQDLALLAITRNRELGIDIEFKQIDFATDEVAEQFFSPFEISQFATIPPELKTEAFFNCWTRKEAYIKGRGEGLSFPLDQFDVTLRPDSTPGLLDNRIDRADVSRWSFLNLFPAPDYAATLAVEGSLKKIQLWDFDSSQ